MVQNDDDESSPCSDEIPDRMRQRMAKLYERMNRNKSHRLRDSAATHLETFDEEQEIKKPPELNRLTNHFKEPSIERAYQIYCAKHGFKRARFLMAIVILLHILVSVGFAFLDVDDHRGLDLLPRRYDYVGEWVQWGYLFIGLPLCCWPSRSSPFRRYWKRYGTAFIVAAVFGIQVWLTYQVSESTAMYKEAIGMRLECSANMTDDAEAPYRGGRSVPDFLIERNSNLNAAFVGIAVILCTLVGSTLAVAVRLDFTHVVCVCVSTTASLISVFAIYEVRLPNCLIGPYVCPIFLLSLSCYYADQTARLSYVSRRKVQRENQLLEAALHEAEEALRNGAARESEKQAVNEGLLSAISSSSSGQSQGILESVRIPFDELKLIKLVGRGGMGEVILGEYLGTRVVCKRMLREHISVTALKGFRREIELMACLRHPNIVQFIGATWDNCSNIAMVMEYMPNSDVHSVLHSTMGSRFTWSDPLLKIAIDASQGMMYLHAQVPPIVHRDLKSVNLLCSATFGCKVSDFGLSRRQEAVDALTTVVGTPFWLAPEIIRNERYGTKADVYAFGIVLTELETRKTPYHDQSQTGLKILMRIGKDGLRPTIPDTCRPHLRQLIRECLEDEPHKRPTFSEVLARLQGPIREEIVGGGSIVQRRTQLQRQSRGLRAAQIELTVLEEDSSEE